MQKPYIVLLEFSLLSEANIYDLVRLDKRLAAQVEASETLEQLSLLIYRLIFAFSDFSLKFWLFIALRKSREIQDFLFNSALASLFLITIGLAPILLSLCSAKGAGLTFQRLEIDYCLGLWIPFCMINTLESSVFDFFRA